MRGPKLSILAEVAALSGLIKQNSLLINTLLPVTDLPVLYTFSKLTGICYSVSTSHLEPGYGQNMLLSSTSPLKSNLHRAYCPDPVCRSREIRDDQFDVQEIVPPQKYSERRDTFIVELDQFSVRSHFVMQTLRRNSIPAITVGFVDFKKGPFNSYNRNVRGVGSK